MHTATVWGYTEILPRLVLAAAQFCECGQCMQWCQVNSSPRGTLRVSGKQNSLFPSWPVIKCLLSHVNEQLRAQITWLNTSHGQNGKCIAHVLKRSTFKKSQKGG